MAYASKSYLFFGTDSGLAETCSCDISTAAYVVGNKKKQ